VGDSERGPTLRRGIVVVTALLASLPIVAVERAAATGTCGHPAGWSAFGALPASHDEIDGNAVPTGGNEPMRSFTRVGDTAKTFLITDASKIFRSANDGCTWSMVFDASTMTTDMSINLGLANNPNYIVATVVAPAYPSVSPRVYAVLMPSYLEGTLPETYQVQLPTLLAESNDGGMHWKVQGDPTTAEADVTNWPHCFSGWFAEAAVAPSNADVVYLDCEVDGVTRLAAGTNAFVLFRSANAGTSWSIVNPDKSLYGSLTDAHPAWAVDPVNANVLYHMQMLHAIVEVSQDGGKTWSGTKLSPVGASDVGDAGLDVIRPRGAKTTHVLAWSTDSGAFESVDGGRHWASLGKFIPAGAEQIDDAAYFGAAGDAIVARTVGTLGTDGALQPSCTSTMRLIRYVGVHRRAVPWSPPPQARWGTLLTLTGMASAGPGRLFADASFRTSGKNCTQTTYGAAVAPNNQSIPGLVFADPHP
jgi:hypothetical protein